MPTILPKKDGTAEVKFVSPEGLYLVVDGKGYFAAFSDFPYLADLPNTQMFKVEYCGNGHIRWEEADIDLHVKILEQPENYPVIMNKFSSIAAAEMGKKGGKAKTRRKKASSRLNGLKGGRPRKKSKLTHA